MWLFKQKSSPLLPTSNNSPAQDDEYQIILKNLKNAKDVFGESSERYEECRMIAQDHLASNKNVPVSKGDSHDEVVAKLEALAIGSQAARSR